MGRAIQTWCVLVLCLSACGGTDGDPAPAGSSGGTGNTSASGGSGATPSGGSGVGGGSGGQAARPIVTWSSPTTLAGASPNGFVDTALGAAGELWVVYQGTRHGIATFDAVAGFGTPTSLHEESQARYTPQVEFNTSGLGLASWVLYEDGGDVLLLSSFTAGAWTAPVKVSVGRTEVQHLYLNEAGQGLVIWDEQQQLDAAAGTWAYRIKAASYGNGDWGQPVVLAENTNGNYWPRGDIDEQGRALVAWRSRNGETSTSGGLGCAYYDGTSWGPPEVADVGVAGIYSTDVALTESGSGVLAYTRLATYVREYVPGVGALDALELEDPGYPAWIRVALRPDGSGLMVGAGKRVLGWERSADGSWSSAVEIQSAEGGDAPRQHDLVVTASGGVVGWAWGSGIGSARVATYRPGTGWSQSAILDAASGSGAGVCVPSVQLRSDGTAFAAWSHWDTWPDGELRVSVASPAQAP